MDANLVHVEGYVSVVLKIGVTCTSDSLKYSKQISDESSEICLEYLGATIVQVTPIFSTALT